MYHQGLALRPGIMSGHPFWSSSCGSIFCPFILLNSQGLILSTSLLSLLLKWVFINLVMATFWRSEKKYSLYTWFSLICYWILLFIEFLLNCSLFGSPLSLSLSNWTLNFLLRIHNIKFKIKAIQKLNMTSFIITVILFFFFRNVHNRNFVYDRDYLFSHFINASCRLYFIHVLWDLAKYFLYSCNLLFKSLLFH